MKAGDDRDNLRLGVSAVQHDMKREETVEEVEKNTELERQTPKRKAGSSSLPGDASKQCCKPVFMRVCSFFAVSHLYHENNGGTYEAICSGSLFW